MLLLHQLEQPHAFVGAGCGDAQQESQAEGKDFLHIDCGFLVSLNGERREERALASIPSAKTISACKGSNYFWGGSDAVGCFPLLSQGES